MMGLPASVYDLYDQVVKGCKVCAEAAPRPQRSHVSGLRANNFGDLVFVDHLQLSHKGEAWFVLVVLDGATNMLWAAPQRSKSNAETLEHLRDWMDNNQCVPTCVVADMAFANGDMDRFYRHWNIRFLPTGPRTPWPNRAESAVRLFKRMYHLLSNANLDPTLPEPTLRQLCRVLCYARNTQLTQSGFSPL